MHLTNDAAAIFAGLLLLYLAVLAGVGLLAIFLWRRGYRVISGILAIGVLGWIFVPSILSYIEAAQMRSTIEARSFWPDALPLAGRDVLFVEFGSSICDDLCGEAVAIGGLGRVYSLGLNGFDWSGVSAEFFEDIRDVREVSEVVLGEPNEAFDGRRFAEPTPVTEFPTVDLVIVDDQSGSTVAYCMGDSIGQPFRPEQYVQQTRFVFEGWPAVGDQPIVAMVNGLVHTRPPLLWPIQTNSEPVPHYGRFDTIWRGWFCTAAATGQGAEGDPNRSDLCADM